MTILKNPLNKVLSILLLLEKTDNVIKVVLTLFVFFQILNHQYCQYAEHNTTKTH